MTTRVFYTTTDLASYKVGSVVLFDDAIPEEWGLAESGYFVEIKDPEPQHAAESAHRAG